MIKIKEPENSSGVDKGLVAMFLKMTPEERLWANDNAVRAILELRNAYQQQKRNRSLSLRTIQADVKFILVGGLAAVVQGALNNTIDVDIVHNQSSANIDRLFTFLKSK